MNDESSNVRIFVSYARKDIRRLEDFLTHTKPLARRKDVTLFYDELLKPGEDFENRIFDTLGRVDIFIALITAEFVASDYCYEHELRIALERQKVGECRIFPINVDSVDRSPGDPFWNLNFVPSARPIVQHKHRSEAWRQTARALRQMVEEVISERP